jgi:hypothetical protein
MTTDQDEIDNLNLVLAGYKNAIDAKQAAAREELNDLENQLQAYEQQVSTWRTQIMQA